MNLKEAISILNENHYKVLGKPVMNESEKQRRFNVTIADIAHWAGLSAEVTRDEINKFIERRKIEVYDNYMIVNNINDMKRTVDTRGGARGAGL